MTIQYIQLLVITLLVATTLGCTTTPQSASTTTPPHHKVATRAIAPSLAAKTAPPSIGPSSLPRAKSKSSGQPVFLYFSPVCQEDLLHVVYPETNCEALDINSYIQSIMINGQCILVRTRAKRRGCYYYRDGNTSQTTMMYRDPDCKEQVILFTYPQTDCSNLTSDHTIHSIKRNKKCHNIDPLLTKAACEKYKSYTQLGSD